MPELPEMSAALAADAPEAQDGLSVYGVAPETPEEKTERQKREIEQHFKTQVEQAQTSINSRKFGWKRNVELRQGNPLGAYGSVVQGLDDDYQSEVNPDWYLTKTKVAALFSQVPKVQVTHENPQFMPAASPFSLMPSTTTGRPSAFMPVAPYLAL